MNAQPCTHEWTENTTTDDPWACTQCGTTTHACQDCNRPMESDLTICRPCLKAAKRLLEDIRTYLAEIPDFAREALNLRAIRYDKAPRATDDDARLPFSLDAVHDNVDTCGPSTIRTREGALDLLETWVDDWAERSGDHDGVHDTLTYLRDHTLWAAQNHPAWDDYLTELRATRAVVRRLAGFAPEPEPVPCVHCGGRIVHDWTPTGLSDAARCTRCGLMWDTKTRLDFANLTHLRSLPETHPEILVTPAQARAIHPGLKAGTLRQWIHRHDIRPQATDLRGEPLIRLADLTTRVARLRLV